MDEGHKETAMSRKAREIIGELAHPDSPMGKRVSTLRYDERLRDRVFPSGEASSVALAEMFDRFSYPVDFLPCCINLNLTEADVEGMFQVHYRNMFVQRESITTARRLYTRDCKLFGILPSDDFPDWGDWRESMREDNTFFDELIDLL